MVLAKADAAPAMGLTNAKPTAVTMPKDGRMRIDKSKDSSAKCVFPLNVICAAGASINKGAFVVCNTPFSICSSPDKR